MSPDVAVEVTTSNVLATSRIMVVQVGGDAYIIGLYAMGSTTVVTGRMNLDVNVEMATSNVLVTSLLVVVQRGGDA